MPMSDNSIAVNNNNNNNNNNNWTKNTGMNMYQNEQKKSRG